MKVKLAGAYEDGVIRNNPAARPRLGPKALAAPVKEMHAPSEEELGRVLAEISDEFREPIMFLADTFARVGDAALTKADVDFGRRTVRVSRRLSRGEVGGTEDVAVGAGCGAVAGDGAGVVVAAGDGSRRDAAVRSA